MTWDLSTGTPQYLEKDMEHPSYAQAHEDDRLWWLVGHEKKNGFFIDIGAHDPEFLSVSRSFYEYGWRGINVEPQRKFFLRLKELQPESLNLPYGVSDKPGRAMLWNGGLTENGDGEAGATFDVEIAAARKFNHVSVCQLVTLKYICDLYEIEQIDWMKIDVEGFEMQVLKGGDWDRYRPDYLCIEAFHPAIPGYPTHEKWEPFVLDHGYKFVDDDYLNRYYVRAEL